MFKIIKLLTLLLTSFIFGQYDDAIFIDPSIEPPKKIEPALKVPVNLHITSKDEKIYIDFSEVDSLVSYEVARQFENMTDSSSYGTFAGSPIIIDKEDDDDIFFLKIRASKGARKGPFTELLGASYASNRPKILIVNGNDRIVGTNNTFNYILQHGIAVFDNGYDFDSASNEAIINGWINLSDYNIVVWMLGEEGVSTSSFSEREQYLVRKYLISGGKIFVSGSEIGYDLVQKGTNSDKKFFREILKSRYITDAVGGRKSVYRIKSSENSIIAGINFNYDDGSGNTYDVDWPDGVIPIGNANRLAVFSGLSPSVYGGAGIYYKGLFKDGIMPGAIVYMTIGFEAIYPGYIRNDIMGRVLNYFDAKTITPEISQKTLDASYQKGMGITGFYNNHEDKSITIEFYSNEYEPYCFLTIQDNKNNEIFKMRIYELPVKKQRFRWTGFTKYGEKAPSGVYSASIVQGKKSVTRKFKLIN